MGWQRARQRRQEDERGRGRWGGEPARWVRPPGGLGELECPGQPEALPDSEVGALSQRLYEPSLPEDERRGVIAFLAAHRSPRASDALRRFTERGEGRLVEVAQRALERAEVQAVPRGPCPCGSGSRTRDCCAWRLP